MGHGNGARRGNGMGPNIVLLQVRFEIFGMNGGFHAQFGPLPRRADINRIECGWGVGLQYGRKHAGKRIDIAQQYSWILSPARLVPGAGVPRWG